MGLAKYKFSDLIGLSDKRNNELFYGIDNVRGISIQKIFIETKADMDGVPLHSYFIVYPDSFAYVTVTSRNGEKITLAHNTTKDTYIVSSSYIVFYVKRKDLLLSDYLFMYFNRPEFDRYSRFHSWGSARETFSWEEMCDIEIELPSIDIQKKYVNIYNAMVANQQSYESGLEDLKLVFEGYIDKLCKMQKQESIGQMIELVENRNDSLKYGIDDVRGVSIEKKFILTKADMSGVVLKPYYIVQPDEFAYVTVTSRNGEKISLARNNSGKNYICSSSYIVFRVSSVERLLPSYLNMYFERSEFDRYCRFNSWGSARETFDWNEMCEVKIPIPDMNTQKSIVEIYNSYLKRKEINEKLKSQLKKLCPILIKGSLEEAGA
ncbi:MAG: restriction endonuclease subunit S [Lachnospiraceae bacterium]|nr:restriction endonuclease subunit S [Lachnospiraceae bacterium]